MDTERHYDLMWHVQGGGQGSCEAWTTCTRGLNRHRDKNMAVLYFDLVLSSAKAATKPRKEGVNVSMQVAYHVSIFPLLQGTIEAPFCRFPSDLSIPLGSRQDRMSVVQSSGLYG